MGEPRFDVIYRGDDVSIDYHFCLEWDDEGGCNGTKSTHGMSFDAAVSTVAAHYEALAQRWRGLTLDKWMVQTGQKEAADG